MAEETFESIERLKGSINTLVERYEEALYSRNSYYAELDRIKKDLINTKDKIAEQEKRLEHYELLGAFASNEVDSKQAKKRISKIVKEIDKCISLLTD